MTKKWYMYYYNGFWGTVPTKSSKPPHWFYYHINMIIQRAIVVI